MNRIDQKGSLKEKSEEPQPSLGLHRPSRRLAALTSSALALPGIAGIAGTANADAPIERAEAKYAFSFYDEDPVRDHNLEAGAGGGDPERYEILTHQLRFDLPVAERIDLGVSFLYEEMSGSSPWFVTANGPGGKPLQVLSGATIEDERFDMVVDGDFYMENGKDTFSFGVSTERDYLSIHTGIGVERNFNDKNTSLSVSGAFSYDWIEPTDAEAFSTRPSNEEKWGLDLFLGLSQVLSRSAIGQVTFNYKHSNGYLSDPYKAIQNLDGAFGLLPDSRPDEKHQFTMLGRIRQHIEPLNASVHFDYQFYVDTYKVTSHTVELAWYQTFFDVVTVTPALRYYSQSKAEFYDPVLPVNVIPRFRSNDFRLSAFGAFSTKLNVEVALVDLINTRTSPTLERFGMSGGIDLFFNISYERYLSDGAYALTSVSDFDEAPGLVGFQVFAATFRARF